MLAQIEHGDATVSRPSVCLSVTFRYHDHIGWNSSKIISRPNRPIVKAHALGDAQHGRSGATQWAHRRCIAVSFRRRFNTKIQRFSDVV